jgi:hypothetical protein
MRGVLFVALLGSALANNCGINPIVLAVQNGSLDTNGIASNRGIQIRFGNQKSLLTLRATYVRNNARIRNADDCSHGNSSENIGCVGASGSVFQNDADSEFQQYSNVDWKSAVVELDPALSVPSVQGHAPAKFDTIPPIDMPLEIWSNSALNIDLTNKSFVALGPESSLLRNMVQSKNAPSNFTAYYHGSRSYQKYADGELVIGGWNQARVNGSWTNYTMGQPGLPIECSLVVKVNAFDLHNNLGSIFPLIEPGASVMACIDPLQNAFTINNAMWQKWVNATQRPPAPSPTDYQTYPLASEPLLGSLSIQLDGGYKTTVPHYELVNPDRGAVLAGSGIYGVYANSSRIQAAVSSGPSDYGEEFGILLGGVFLSSTYMFVDPENNRFGLAPSTPDDKVGSQSIRPVCSNSATVGPLKKKGLSGGAIAGIVIGSVIFIIFVILAVLCFAFRTKARTILGRKTETQEIRRPDLQGANLTTTTNDVAHSDIPMADRGGVHNI